MAKSPLRILVVEDEPLLQRLMVTALQHRGYRVDLCGDGEAALRKLEEGRYDLVITDFRMPRMTGVQLIQALRSRPERIPIVLTSSNTIEEMGIGERDVAGIEFLRKPFGLTDLYAAIERALARPG